jgi:hypothetical protein
MDRTTPIGLYCFGVSYLDTARAAHQANSSIPFSDPIEFLCAHGLELIFKAEVSRTLDLEIVRKRYGHNLLRLRSALGTEFLNAFPIDHDLENTIQYLAIGHSGPNYRNRYIETGVRSALLPDQILPTLSVFHTDKRQWLTSHFVKVVP